MQSLPLYNRYLANLYVTEIYPFELILRFITCNKPEDVSPQCREMRLEGFSMRPDPSGKWDYDRSIQSRFHITKFNRKNATNLKEVLCVKRPLAIHIKNFITLNLEKETFNSNNHTTVNTTLKRKPNDTAFADKARYELLNQEKPLVESRGREYTHYVTQCKELVFDVDVPDFDRFCDCAATQRKTLCATCWLHIEGCYFIMNFIFTAIFGYPQANLLYVFSGGKGLHCFNNDPRAMALNQEQRDTIFNYVKIGKEDDMALCQWIVSNATPELSKRLEALFRSHVLVSRDLLRQLAFRRWVALKIDKYYPSTYQSIRTRWCLDDANAFTFNTHENVSLKLWDMVVEHARYEHYNVDNAMSVVTAPLFIIYRVYYPIIDPGPLLMTHEIKLPFSIHATTMNIALPIDQAFIETTDKSSLMLTLDQLCQYYRRIKPGQLPPQYSNAMAITDEWLKMY